MIRYSLRQLEYAVAAADHGSIAAAAVEMGVSQPSMSAAIAKLEGQIGTQLFLRHHAQGVSPTPAGRRLIADARNLLRHAAEIEREGRRSDPAGTLELASYTTIAPVFLPRLITRFQAMHPQAHIRMHEGTQDVLIDGLRQGLYELALVYDVELPPDVTATALAEIPPYALLPAGHRLADRETLELSELADEPMILLDVPPSRQYFLGLMRKAGHEPRIAFSSPSLELVRGMVGRGLGFALLATRPAGDRTYDGRPLAVVPLADAAEPARVVLAQLTQLRPTRLMQAFADHCATTLREPEEAP